MMRRRVQTTFDKVLLWDRPLACLRWSSKAKTGQLKVVAPDRSTRNFTVRNEADLEAAFKACGYDMPATGQ